MSRNILVVFVQVSASTNKEVDGAVPNYPGLQPQLICQLHNVTMHVSCVLYYHRMILYFKILSKDWFLKSWFSKLQADVETDEVYAQMTLQPLTPVIYY